jgi:CDP-diacylglycerol--glycerol-3-phosphate 3-phosphatidyltransferase
MAGLDAADLCAHFFPDCQKAPQMKKPASPYNLANLLSLARIILVPVFIVLMKEERLFEALLCFVGASLTDFFDGWLARSYGWQTPLGEFIDPLGDKLLTVSAVLLLNLHGVLPFWTVVAAFARELMVVCGYVLIAVLARLTALKVSWFGKGSTLCQMVFLGLVLGSLALQWDSAINRSLTYCLEAAVALNFLSGLDYAVRGIHDYEKNRRGQKA